MEQNSNPRRRPRVYIVNDSGHDFSAAKQYGDVIFLSQGDYSRYALNRMLREFAPKMVDSEPYDYILATAYTQMNMVATAIMARLHGRVNILIHHKKQPGEPNRDGYLERTVMLDSMLGLVDQT